MVFGRVPTTSVLRACGAAYDEQRDRAPTRLRDVAFGVARPVVRRGERLLRCAEGRSGIGGRRQKRGPGVWEALRKTIEELDGHTCQACGKEGLTGASRRRAAARGADDPSNLMTLCGRCHLLVSPIPDWLCATPLRHRRRFSPRMDKRLTNRLFAVCPIPLSRCRSWWS